MIKREVTVKNESGLHFDGDELLVEVVEGRTRRFQPVLEDSHIAGVPVVLVAAAYRVDREGDELLVFPRGQGPGAGELRVIDRAVDEVPPGDYHVVPAAEEP